MGLLIAFHERRAADFRLPASAVVDFTFEFARNAVLRLRIANVDEAGRETVEHCLGQRSPSRSHSTRFDWD
jgi:hypothetical protein